MIIYVNPYLEKSEGWFMMFLATFLLGLIKLLCLWTQNVSEGQFPLREVSALTSIFFVFVVVNNAWFLCKDPFRSLAHIVLVTMGHLVHKSHHQAQCVAMGCGASWQPAEGRSSFLHQNSVGHLPGPPEAAEFAHVSGIFSCECKYGHIPVYILSNFCWINKTITDLQSWKSFPGLVSAICKY